MPKTKIPAPPKPKKKKRIKRKAPSLLPGNENKQLVPNALAERIESISKVADMNTESIRNLMDYIRANDEHLNEIGNSLSQFIKKRDIGELIELKQEIKTAMIKIERLEEKPIVPPFPSASKNELGTLVTKIRALEETVKNLENETRSRQDDTTGLFQDIFAQLNKLNDFVYETTQKNSSQEKKIENELRQAKRDSEQIKILSEIIENLDAESLLRDIESMKTKSQWLEQKIEKLNLKGLYDKIEELEHTLRLLKVSSPYVVE